MQNKHEKYEYDTILKNPTTVKILATQIISASDSYLAMKIPEKEYQELIVYWAKYHGNKLFSYSHKSELNPTLLNRIGKKRTELAPHMLCGYQTKLF